MSDPTEPGFSIRREDLPDGLAESIDRPPNPPAEPRPAATVVLARPGSDGFEVLLVRRNRQAGFVPGAYVFPGGRVDPEDGASALASRVRGLTPDRARSRLGTAGPSVPPLAYYLSAVREAFEETGVLLATTEEGGPAPTAAEDAGVDEDRRRLLEHEITFHDLLVRRNWWVDGARIEYVAHWITPEVEPRRYDTRFFLAAVPGGTRVVLDEREMIAERWMRPTEALAARASGQLPMVFPTIVTLQSLQEFATLGQAVAAFANRAIPTVLPRFVRTSTGVGIEIPEEPSG